MGEQADYIIDSMYDDDEYDCYGDCGNCPQLYWCGGEGDCGPPGYYFKIKLEKGILEMIRVQKIIEARINWKKKHSDIPSTLCSESVAQDLLDMLEFDGMYDH